MGLGHSFYKDRRVGLGQVFVNTIQFRGNKNSYGWSGRVKYFFINAGSGQVQFLCGSCSVQVRKKRGALFTAGGCRMRWERASKHNRSGPPRLLSTETLGYYVDSCLTVVMPLMKIIISRR